MAAFDVVLIAAVSLEWVTFLLWIGVQLTKKQVATGAPPSETQNSAGLIPEQEVLPPFLEPYHRFNGWDGHGVFPPSIWK